MGVFRGRVVLATLRQVGFWRAPRQARARLQMRAMDANVTETKAQVSALAALADQRVVAVAKWRNKAVSRMLPQRVQYGLAPLALMHVMRLLECICA
jgi:hypothetical protein